MSNHLFAMLLPFLNFRMNMAEDGGGGAAPEAVEANETEQAPTPEKVEETETASEQQPEKTFTQAELDEIVQKRISKLERKMERQRIEAETRAKVTQELQARPEPAQEKPTVDKFATYDEYLEAIADWKAEQKFLEIQQREKNKETEAKQKSESQRVTERQTELIEAGERKYDDFEDVVKSDKNEYSRAAYLAILESDKPEEIVYYLAKNPDEAAKLAQLPAYAQAKEIGKLEDKLSAKKPVKTSNAPKPIDPIGSGSAHSKTVEAMNMDEYLQYRKKQNPRWA